MRQVFITGATAYKEVGLRSMQAFDSIRKATELGWQTIISDDSIPEVRVWLEKAGAIVLRTQRPGLGPQKREAIRKAVEKALPDDIIFTTEIERPTLIPLLPQVVEAYQTDSIAVIGRKDLNSYPVAQQHAENYGNRIFAIISGIPLDVWFGPRAFRPGYRHFFTDYSPGPEDEDMWDSFFVPLLYAKQEGITLFDFRLDFQYPTAQRDAEENDIEMQIKRLRQLNNIVPALYRRAKALGMLE